MTVSSSKNKLGLWTSTSLVIGNMIASAIFLLPAVLAKYGSISLVGWALSAVGAFFLARVFARLSRLMPASDGGPYTYTRSGFGDFAGFLVAWGYWISVWSSNAAIAVLFVSSLGTFFPILATNPAIAVLTGLCAIWLLTWVNTLGVYTSGKVQLVTTILKLTPLVFVAVGGLFFVHSQNFLPFNISHQSNFSTITTTGTITLFAFLGVECATIPAGNVNNPEKTIPRATMLGTLITTAVYILCTFTVMGMIPGDALRLSNTPVADAAFIIGGKSARYLVSGGVAIAAFGALNGWILIQGQIPYAVAKDKLFSPLFKKENKKGVPAIGLIIGSILASVLMMMNYSKGLADQYQILILLSTLTSVVPYLFCAAALAIISAKNTTFTRRKLFQVIVLASLSFAFSLWAIIGAGQDTVYWGFILLMCGVPFYVWIAYKKNKDTDAKKITKEVQEL
jgi:APA family basic amino acid/polyamine antiporter